MGSLVGHGDFPPRSWVFSIHYRKPPNVTVPFSLDQIGPWGRVPQPPIGIFQQNAGGAWAMNDEGGYPFPCPAPGGAAPGPNNGALPPEVVKAWHRKYEANCANVIYPMQPN